MIEDNFLSTASSEEAVRPPALLVGREAECARIAELLAGARRQRSGALVLVGDAGVGKTALCAWAVGQASEMRIRVVRAVESEIQLPYAGVAELCAGEDLVELLPAPQAHALETVLARRDASFGDRFAVGAAVLSLVGAGGEHSSTLLVVDDAHWLDAASADALLFAARRVRREGVAILVATRPGGMFDRQRAGVPRLSIGGLDPGSARVLLATEHREMPAEVVGLLIEHARGNPLALLEMPHVLNDAQLAGLQSIDQPLPVGPTLQRALLGRLSGLPDHTRRALLVAAASGSERIQPVLDALDELGLDREVLDAAEDTGVLAITHTRVEFRHPLLRAAVYHAASGPRRRAAHAALARVTDGGQRAWHQAHATVGEDESVAASLEIVALDGRRRGAPAAAAAAWEQAARVSEPGERRARRLTEAARSAYLAGHSGVAIRLLDDALPAADGAIQRADIQHLRGQVLVSQGRSELAFGLLQDESARIREIDPDRAAAMLVDACLHCLVAADARRALALASEARRAATGATLDVRAYATMMLACALIWNGHRAKASKLLDRFLPILREAPPLSDSIGLVAVAAQCYFWVDRYDIASQLLTRLIDAARESATPTALLLPLTCRAELHIRTGRWPVAAAQLDEVAHLGNQMANSVYAAYASECLAWLAAAAGDAGECREHAARATTLQHGSQFGRLYIYSALGLLELSLDRVTPAIHNLERARDVAESNGMTEPNIVHWQADLIEAYARAGRSNAAREALDALDEQARRTGGRWALGTAARCRGLLTDGPATQDWFDAALEHLEALKAPFEIARTQLCRGERLRRAGQRLEAGHALRDAIQTFDQLGAKAWAARARRELRATGAKPRRRNEHCHRDDLTPHELQVALIVATGASNRDASAALFLSPKTIEFHLGHIYRKLGVRSRTELATLAVRRGWLDDPDRPLHPN